MEKHHLDGQPEEARFYIPEGADNKGVPYGNEGEMPLTAGGGAGNVYKLSEP